MSSSDGVKFGAAVTVRLVIEWWSPGQTAHE